MAVRKTYGNSPWGAYFLEILECSNDLQRLNRGRTYANTGRVADFSLQGPTVSAKVEGNYQPWYQVSLEFPEFSPAEKAKTLDLIRRDPITQAAIRSGDLPMGLIKTLATADLDLIPRRWNLLKRSCSCPDHGNPCKHMAALYYMMVREIDQNPMSIFRLRGIDLPHEFPQLAAPEIAPLVHLRLRDTPFVPPPAKPGYGLTDSYINLIISLWRPAPAFYPQGDFKTILTDFYHFNARRYHAILTLGTADPYARTGRGTSNWLAETNFSLSLAKPATGFPPNGFQFDLNHPLGGLKKYQAIDLAPAFLSAEDDYGTDSYRFLFHLYRFFYQLLRASALIPAVWQAGRHIRIAWKPLSAIPEVAAQLAVLASYAPPMIALPTSNPQTVPAASLGYCWPWPMITSASFISKPPPPAMYNQSGRLFSISNPLMPAIMPLKALPGPSTPGWRF